MPNPNNQNTPNQAHTQPSELKVLRELVGALKSQVNQMEDFLVTKLHYRPGKNEPKKKESGEKKEK